MKKTSLKISMIVLSMGLFFAACKKKTDTVTPDDSAQQTTTASDQSNASAESDQAVNDANIVLSGSPTNGRMAGTGAIIAGAAIDSTVTGNYANGKYVITYNGNNADGTKNRTGTITLQLTGKWSAPNSVLTITFTNYKVTRLSTGKSITLNGTKTVKNVSLIAHNYWNLPADGSTSIDHKVRGTLNITFDDGTTRSWNIARHRKVIHTTAGAYTLALSGDTAVGGYGSSNNTIEAWGVNRSGENFYGEITSPLVFSTACIGELISGIYVHEGIARTLTVTFGVNSDGTVNTSTACPYGFKFDWINAAGTAKEIIKAY
jgi:hypothetical protein